jgi:hypothetical protein
MRVPAAVCGQRDTALLGTNTSRPAKANFQFRPLRCWFTRLVREDRHARHGIAWIGGRADLSCSTNPSLTRDMDGCSPPDPSDPHSLLACRSSPKRLAKGGLHERNRGGVEDADMKEARTSAQHNVEHLIDRAQLEESWHARGNSRGCHGFEQPASRLQVLCLHVVLQP